MSNRVEGQIWIDRNSPYRLKYHINEKDYVVEISSSYSLDSSAISSDAADGDILLPAGLLVKLDSNNGIEAASFPDDLESVLGVITQDVRKLSSTTATEVVVGRNGYLTIDEPWDVFVELEGTDANSFVEKLPIPDSIKSNYGLPIYWYIGKSGNAGGKMTYTSSEGSEGKLTFNTPVGFRWEKGMDPSLNVAYDNLPQIGTLVGIENGKMYIHLNFSKFDSTIEWTWPGVHSSGNDPGDCGRIGPTLTEDKTEQTFEEIKIRHGLFADSSSNYHKVRSFCDIVALKDHEADGTNPDEYLIQAPTRNITTGNDRYTEITISSLEALYYRISGRINYKFDKGGK
jgi:hypothetical protein